MKDSEALAKKRHIEDEPAQRIAQILGDIGLYPHFLESLQLWSMETTNYVLFILPICHLTLLEPALRLYGLKQT